MGAGGGCCVGNCCVQVNYSVPTEPNDTDEISAAQERIQEMAQAPEEVLFSFVSQSTAELKDFLNQFTVEKKYAGHKLKFDVENLDTIEKKFVAEVSGFIVAKVERRLVPEDKGASRTTPSAEKILRHFTSGSFATRLKI